ncbi:MAG: ABC transporter ATP-binding protein [Woeseiaceae bacterium]
MGDVKDESVETEPTVGKDQGFTAIIKIFARTWPFLRTYIHGYWREFPANGSATDAENNGQWSYAHVPPLVTILAALGPVSGLVPYGETWLYDFLVISAAILAVLSWGLLFAKGRLYGILSAALASVAAVAFLFAVFAVDGQIDNVYMFFVVAACACIWALQFRLEPGRIRFRIRLGSHLVYYFVLVWASSLLLLLIALFSVDVISQSILQAKPLTPFVADLISKPEMAVQLPEDGTTDTGANIEQQQLSDEQRHQLKWVYAVFLLVGWFIQLPVTLLLPYYYVYIMQRVNQDLRVALLEQWHQLSLRYHSNHRVGDSVYRLYQDSAQVTAVIGEITQALQVIITYFTGILFLFALDPILGAMALMIIAFTLLWARWFSPHMREKSLASRRANSDFTSRVQETFAGARLIKAYGAEQAEQERFEKDSVRAFNASYRVRSLVAIIGIVSFTITAGALLYGQFLTAIWAVGEREVYATVLVGLVGLSFLKWNLSAYQSAQEQLGASSNAIRDLVDRWTKAQDMAMGLTRAFDILDIEPDIVNDPDAVPVGERIRKIEFDSVSFAYEPDRPVLSDVSFSVEPGSVTAIVGPTGSGKTTLMGMLSRLYDPDTGSVSIDDVDLRKIDLDSLRANVSIALQENVLFGMSLRDNIRYVVPDASDEQVMEAARVACVDEYIAGLPDGLDTVLSDRGGKLSTGQRQRLSIARSLVKDTPILILDEPTAALDADTEHRVLERLAEWGENRSVFLITHRISTIQKANHILYIDKGRLIESGSHAELMKIDGGRYRNFVETEARLSKRLNVGSSVGGDE